MGLEFAGLTVVDLSLGFSAQLFGRVRVILLYTRHREFFLVNLDVATLATFPDGMVLNSSKHAGQYSDRAFTSTSGSGVPASAHRGSGVREGLWREER